jgi:hypothetical protein
MAYHVGVFEGSDIYGEKYKDYRLVVIWESAKGAVVDVGLGGLVPGGTEMRIFGASCIDAYSLFGKETIAKASPDEVLSMTDAAIDRAYQNARLRALRNVSYWKRWWLGRKFDGIWREQSLGPILRKSEQQAQFTAMSANANPALPAKEPSAVKIRRFILLLVEMAVLYFFIYLPWRTIQANFLFFFGFGMIQVSATYISESKSTTWGDTLLSLFVMTLAIGGFIAEIVVGWHSKPWWEALLLPIPPFALASVWFKSHNPAPPFFAALPFLLLALLLKIFV